MSCKATYFRVMSQFVFGRSNFCGPCKKVNAPVVLRILYTDENQQLLSIRFDTDFPPRPL